jgi:phosphatidylglycerol lysyltransferase
MMSSMPTSSIVPSNEELARRLIMQHGWNAVCYQILNPGFTLWFSQARDAVIGYVRRWGVRVVGGGPVCAQNRLGDVVEEFEADALRDGCSVCYFGAGLRLYEDCSHPPDYSVVALGAQPSWNPTGWPAIVAARASLRAQLNRARNKNVVIREWREHSGDTFSRSDLLRCLDEWISTRRMPTMHFLVEPDTLHILTDRRVWIAERAGKLVGYLVASPVPRRNGWLMEQIIRSKRAPNGTNELLVDTTVRALAADGAQYLTLGLVPLSSRADEYMQGNPLWLRTLMRWGRAHGRRFYNFQGLEAFKSKFSPHEWEPIFAISNRRNFTPRTIYAVAAAFSDRSSPMLQGVRAIARAARQEWNWLTRR